MAFQYAYPIPSYQETPTFGSKAVLAKSTMIDIAAGAGGAAATDYETGIILPKGAQVLAVGYSTITAISGGTISAATMDVKTATRNIISAVNVFTQTSSLTMNSAAYLTFLEESISKDYPLYYRFAFTGTGPATAGKFIFTALYVV